MIPVTYISSAGNTYQLHSKNGVVHKYLPYRSWAWKPYGTELDQGVRLAGFNRSAAQFKSELRLYGTKEEQEELIDNLHDDFEGDLRRVTAGKFIVNEYTLNCFVIGADARYKNGATTDIIQIFAPYPYWIQEQKVALEASEVTASEFLDYPYDYAFDFTAPVMGRKIVTSDFPFESEFMMVIYGQAVTPTIVINGYSYILYTTIPAGAYVIIDSRKKSIMMYNTNGTQTDLFNFRNKTQSIFQKIPKGNLEIQWDSSYGVDLTIYRERSEPKGALA